MKISYKISVSFFASFPAKNKCIEFLKKKVSYLCPGFGTLGGWLDRLEHRPEHARGTQLVRQLRGFASARRCGNLFIDCLISWRYNGLEAVY